MQIKTTQLTWFIGEKKKREREASKHEVILVDSEIISVTLSLHLNQGVMTLSLESVLVLKFIVFFCYEPWS